MCIFFKSSHEDFFLIGTNFYFFKDLYLFIFLERQKGREKERERNINVWLPPECPLLGTSPETQACALTRNQTGADTQSTEQHQWGLRVFFSLLFRERKAYWCMWMYMPWPALTGNWTHNLSFYRTTLQPTEYTGQGKKYILKTHLKTARRVKWVTASWLLSCVTGKDTLSGSDFPR